jgi:tetratricopeptide (TPR) repeat protein
VLSRRFGARVRSGRPRAANAFAGAERVMCRGPGRVLIVAAACLMSLTACETSTKLTSFFGSQRDDLASTASIDTSGESAQAESSPAEPATTGSVAVANPPTADPVLNAANPRLFGKDPNDDLNLGKKYFRSANFGLAEKHYRRAVEQHPNDAESWIGLAASYDRLKRFDLADRAYNQAARIVGETPEIMNNRGFSYILRGDYRRARRILERAQAAAPDNPYVQNNLRLLDKTQRRAKSVN